MNPKIIALAALAAALIASLPAEARQRHKSTPAPPASDLGAIPPYPYAWQAHGQPAGASHAGGRVLAAYGGPQAAKTYQRAPEGETVVAHPAGCPWRLFCGCGVSVRVFGHPIRDLYLASNWRRFAPASPRAGMVAWNYRHVFYIEESHGDGTVTAYDPNSGGHLTRVHRVSLRGYHVVDPMAVRSAKR